MKYVLLALFMINAVIWATPVLAEPVTGTIQLPTKRTDGAVIKPGELVKVKVEFKEINTNHFTNIVFTDDLSQFSVDKPQGSYHIYATVFDQQGRESGPSNTIHRVIAEEPIVIEIPLTAPMPPILILIN